MITRRSLIVMISMVVLVIAATACAAETDPDDPYRLAAPGLCEAAEKVRSGDIDGAEEEFFDTVHQPLHDLADEVSEVDRVIAARLLEAKEAVESGLDDDSAELGDEFDTLLEATDEALLATGHNSIPCSTGEAS